MKQQKFKMVFLIDPSNLPNINDTKKPIPNKGKRQEYTLASVMAVQQHTFEKYPII